MKTILNCADRGFASMLRSQFRTGDGRLSGAHKHGAYTMSWDDSLICQNCHEQFSVSRAQYGFHIMPNTLTNLPDHNNPWIQCPHCGFTQ